MLSMLILRNSIMQAPVKDGILIYGVFGMWSYVNYFNTPHNQTAVRQKSKSCADVLKDYYRGHI